MATRTPQNPSKCAFWYRYRSDYRYPCRYRYSHEPKMVRGSGKGGGYIVVSLCVCLC